MFFTIENIDKNDFQKAVPFLFASACNELVRDGIILMAYDDGIACGALGMLKKDNTMHVSSLFVKEDKRNNGVGSGLVREAEQMADALGMTGITFSYACDRERALLLDSFFIKNGYPMPVEGNTMATLSIEDIEKSAFAQLAKKIKSSDNIIPFTAISGQVLENLKAKVETRIPRYMTLFEAAGKPIPDLTTAYVNHGSVSAYITITDTNGVLHFDAAYLDDTSETVHLLMLLKKAYETIRTKYTQYQLMTVTGKTESGTNLMDKLLQGVPMQYTSMYTAGKRLVSASFTPTGYGEAVAFFNSITEAMTEEKIATGLVMIDGQMPYMEVYTEDEKTLLGLYYSKGNISELSIFTAESIFSVKDKWIRNKLIDEINAEEGPCYALVSNETGDILLRNDYEIFTDDENIDIEKIVQEFILPFRKYAQDVIKNYEGTLY